MSNSMPCKPRVSVEPTPDYSLPYPLIQKQLDTSPLPWNFKKNNDDNYIPPALNLEDSDFTSNSSSYQTSFSRSSYDPLEDLSGYLKMRDKL